MSLRIDRSFLHVVRCVSSARDEFPLLRRERVRTKDHLTAFCIPIRLALCNLSLSARSRSNTLGRKSKGGVNFGTPISPHFVFRQRLAQIDAAPRENRLTASGTRSSRARHGRKLSGVLRKESRLSMILPKSVLNRSEMPDAGLFVSTEAHFAVESREGRQNCDSISRFLRRRTRRGRLCTARGGGWSRDRIIGVDARSVQLFRHAGGDRAFRRRRLRARGDC